MILIWFFVSKYYLDSSASFDYDNFYIKEDCKLVREDYKLVRATHHGDVKRDGVCVYFKESLPVSCLPNPYLKEYLIFEILSFLLKIREVI